MTKRFITSFVLLITLAMLWPSTNLAAPSSLAAAQNTTYIEFILDASISMTARIGRETRLSIAKSVMEQLICDLPDDPSLFVALRIYGAELNTDLGPCEDSVLVQPFAPAAQAKDNMVKQLRAMEAKGMTPIARSLELAAADFSGHEGARKIVILMTDGEESCGGDPCAVSARLQKQGVFLKPYVVGFALTDKQKKLVECIGEFYEASDTDSLRKALGTVVEQAIQPSTIEVQAMAGSLEVTDKAEITVRRAGGQAVPTTLTASAPRRLRAVVEEGDYIVSGVLRWGAQTLYSNEVRVPAAPGKVVPVRLDFGSIEGRIILKATASAKDVTADVDVQVRKGSETVRPAWAGMPLAAALQAGDYTLTVTHRRYANLRASVPVTVNPGTDTPITVDLGELPAALDVRVMFMGKSVAGACQVSAQYPTDSTKLTLNQSSDSFQMSSTPGKCNVRVTYLGIVSVEKHVQDVALIGGETTRLVIDLDDLLGVLKVKVNAGAVDATHEAQVTASGPQGKLLLPYVGIVREAIVAPGGYMVKAQYRGADSYPAEAYVQAGLVTEIEVDIQMPGKIVLYPTIGGKPLLPGKVDATALDGDGVPVGHFQPSAGALELTCEPGTYTVAAGITDPYDQSITINNVIVKSGATVVVGADFVAATVLRVKLVSDGKPFDVADVSVHFNGSDENWSWMDRISRGVWELKIPNGVHDIVVRPKVDGMKPKRVTGVEVAGGSTAEETIPMGGTGLLRVKLTSDGKPFDESDVTVHFEGSDENWSWMDRISRGVWELKVPEGVHDIVIRPRADGITGRRISGVEIPGSATVEKVLDLSTAAMMRVLLTAGGKPTSGAVVALYGERDEWVGDFSEVATGRFELRVSPGDFKICAVSHLDDYGSKWSDWVEVPDSGGVVEVHLELPRY